MAAGSNVPYIYNKAFEEAYTRIEDKPIGNGVSGTVWKVTKNGDPSGTVYAGKLFKSSDRSSFLKEVEK